jgi:integrase/recombinase XerD
MTNLEILPVENSTLSRSWREAFELWLGGLEADATRRSYTDSWKEFLAFTQKMPWKVGRSDVARWVQDIDQRGLADTTRNLKLAAISSFYIYACTEYTIVSEDGREVPLQAFNPAGGKSLRAKVDPYGKVDPLKPIEVKALLAKIPRDTVQGLRDYALILAYLFTGRRNSEIRKLHWGDIKETEDGIWYTWSGKGKKDQRFELPGNVWEAIKGFLNKSGRLGSMAAGDFIFTALNANAERLPNVKTKASNQPISMREAGKLLKRYARLAGLDHEAIHVHSLRHTAARLRRLAGDDLEEVGAFLAHTNNATTQIYLKRVEGKRDTSWLKVSEMIGI